MRQVSLGPVHVDWPCGSSPMVSCLCTVDPGHGNRDRYLFPCRMPAYELSWWYSLYFVSYIVVNTYLFMSVFLAVVYNNYRKHLKVTPDLGPRGRQSPGWGGGSEASLCACQMFERARFPSA